MSPTTPTKTHWIIAGSPLIATITEKDDDDDENESLLERAAKLFPKFVLCDEDEPDLVLVARAIDQWMVEPAPQDFAHRVLFLRTAAAAAPQHQEDDPAAAADALYLECVHQIAEAEGNPGRQEWWRAVQTLVGPPELSRVYAIIAGIAATGKTSTDESVARCRKWRKNKAMRLFPMLEKDKEQIDAAADSCEKNHWHHDRCDTQRFFEEAGMLDVEPPPALAPFALHWIDQVCYESPGYFLTFLKTAAAFQVFEDIFPGKLTEDQYFFPKNAEAFVFVLKMRLAKMGLPVRLIAQTEDYNVQATQRYGGRLVNWLSNYESRQNTWNWMADAAFASTLLPCPTLRFLVCCCLWRDTHTAKQWKTEHHFDNLAHLRRAFEEDVAHRAGNVRCLMEVSAKFMELGFIDTLIRCAARHRVVVWPNVGSVAFKTMVGKFAAKVFFVHHRYKAAEIVKLLGGDGSSSGDTTVAAMSQQQLVDRSLLPPFRALATHLRELRTLTAWGDGGANIDVVDDDASFQTNVLAPICQWLVCASFSAEMTEKHQGTVQRMATALRALVLPAVLYAGRVPTTIRAMVADLGGGGEDDDAVVVEQHQDNDTRTSNNNNNKRKRVVNNNNNGAAKEKKKTKKDVVVVV